MGLFVQNQFIQRMGWVAGQDEGAGHGGVKAPGIKKQWSEGGVAKAWRSE